MGGYRVLGELREDHAFLGAVLDLADEAGDGAVELFLLGECVAVAGAVGIGLVDGERQEEVRFLLVARHHRVQGVRLRAGSVDQGLLNAQALGLVPGDRVSKAESALRDVFGVDPFCDATVGVVALLAPLDQHPAFLVDGAHDSAVAVQDVFVLASARLPPVVVDPKEDLVTDGQRQLAAAGQRVGVLGTGEIAARLSQCAGSRVQLFHDLVGGGEHEELLHGGVVVGVRGAFVGPDGEHRGEGDLLVRESVHAAGAGEGTEGFHAVVVAPELQCPAFDHVLLAEVLVESEPTDDVVHGGEAAADAGRVELLGVTDADDLRPGFRSVGEEFGDIAVIAHRGLVHHQHVHAGEAGASGTDASEPRREGAGLDTRLGFQVRGGDGGRTRAGDDESVGLPRSTGSVHDRGLA